MRAHAQIRVCIYQALHQIVSYRIICRSLTYLGPRHGQTVVATSATAASGTRGRIVCWSENAKARLDGANLLFAGGDFPLGFVRRCGSRHGGCMYVYIYMKRGGGR